MAGAWKILLRNRFYSSASRSLERPPLSSVIFSKGETPIAAKLAALFFGMIALVVSFAVGAANILNHFYRFGAYLFDSGLLAHLMTHADLAEPLPRVLGGGSFYALHISPIFFLLSELARLSPLSPPQFFAVFIGVAQALLSAGVFWALVGPIGMRTPAGAALAALLAIGFSNNGLAIAILRYPHFEVLIAASLILFLVASHQQRYGIASLFLVIALLTREDAGFHIAILLAAILACRRWHGLRRKGERATLIFLAVAVFYSVAAVALQHWAFPDQLSFARIYAGYPLFAHVSPRMLVMRMLGWWIYRSYALLPAAICIFWSVMRRNAIVVAGYVSTSPWLALHLAAISGLAGTLSSYYAFPLLVASFWPLLGALEIERSAALDARSEAVIGFGVLIAASFTAISAQHNPNQVSFAQTFSPPPSAAAQHAMTEAIADLNEARPALGVFLVGDGIASIAPDAFAESESFWFAHEPKIDTVAYFEAGFQAAEAQSRASKAGLTLHYRMLGTPIRIETDRALEALPNLRGQIERVLERAR